jgi:flagellar assembly protein FliH
MTPSGKAPAGAQVLRGLAVTGQSRVVGRPAQAPSAPQPVPVPAPAESQQARVPAADPALLEAAFEEGRREGLAEARRQAEHQTEQAQRHAGFEQGLREGLAEGRAEGEREAERRAQALQAAVTQRLERLDALAGALPAQLHAHMTTRFEAVEDDVVALCHLAICRLLGEHLVGRDGAAHAVRAAIEQWLQASEEQSRSDLLTAHVHPLDFDAMRADEVLARWLVQQGLRGVHWQASDDVRLGGCLVQGREGDLDARIETQLAGLREVLLRGRGRRAAHERASSQALTAEGRA